MNNKIRLAVIGCGRAAELIYLPLILKNSNVDVTSAIDPIKERREWFAGNLNNCTPAVSLNDTIANSVDAAVISTPPAEHVAIAEELLRCNKYVLVEKPLSLNLENVDNLIHTSANSRASLIMGFNHRYWEPVIKLKEVLSQRRNGDLINAEITFSGNYSMWNPVSFSGDTINDLGPHVFDLVSYLCNEEIYSLAASSEKENHFNINVQTSGGCEIKTLISHSDKTEKKIKIRTTNGSYFINLGSSRIVPLAGTKRKILDYQDAILRKVLRVASPVKRSYEIQFERFINLVRTGISVKPDITDGIAAVKACMAAHLSIIKKREVFLNEIQ